MDDRSDSAAREDGAVFAPARVRGSRSPRILASVVVIAVGALVAIGVLDRQARRRQRRRRTDVGGARRNAPGRNRPLEPAAAARLDRLTRHGQGIADLARCSTSTCGRRAVTCSSTATCTAST